LPSAGEEPRGTTDPEDRAARIREELSAARFSEAEALAREHLVAIAREYGERSLPYAEGLDLFVRTLIGAGRAAEEETERAALRAVELKEEFALEGNPGLGSSLVVLGRVYFNRGDTEAAMPLLGRGLAIQEAALGADDVVLIDTLRAVGNASLAAGDLAGAEEAYRREGELIALHFGAVHMDAAAHAYNTARFMVEVGDYERAESLYRKAADIIQELEGADSARMAYALLGIGNVQTFRGEIGKALETLEHALEIAREQVGSNHPFVASCRTGLGNTLLAMGDLDGARKTFSNAVELAEQTYGPDHEATGRALRLLATTERRAGDLERAQAHLLRARRIFEIAGSEVAGIEAEVEYALLLADRDRIDQAVAEMQAVHDTAAESFPDHPDTALWDVTLADLMLQAGRADEARELLQDLVRRFPPELQEDEAYVEAHAHLALASARSGRVPDALEVAARTETLGLARVRVLISGLSERRALSAAESHASARDLLISLAAADRGQPAVNAAWEAVVRSRGAVLDELARRHRAVADLADNAAAKEFEIASRRLANLLVHGPTGDADAFRRAVSEARARREEAERELARASRSFRRLQEDRAIDLDRVRDALPEGSALVAYVVYENLGSTAERSDAPREYAAFVLSAGNPPRLMRLGPAGEIETTVAATRRLLDVRVGDDDPAREAAYRKQGTELRKLVWDPVEAACGPAGRVFLVPEGVLHLINYATLPTGEDRYLVDSGRDFHLLSSERDLARRPDGPTGNGLLVVGDPDYFAKPASSSTTIARAGPIAPTTVFRGGASECADFASIVFTRLAESEIEARYVARRWIEAHPGPPEPSVLVLTGADATESRFKNEASGRRVLHVATHGFFLNGQCPSAIPGRRGIGGTSPIRKPKEDRRQESPLILSGLALAGFNHRQDAGPETEDGVLTAEEIAALDLGGTEWVVLSACDTGVGQVRPGEGVFGLRRAFSVAGARTLIMTLRPVRDDVAADWMEELYAARLEDGVDTAAAVTRATRTIVERRREDGLSTHPGIWGAFVASGDWR
jgi:tetratricopeptide (TPR) repeat protein